MSSRELFKEFNGLRHYDFDFKYHNNKEIFVFMGNIQYDLIKKLSIEQIDAMLNGLKNYKKNFNKINIDIDFHNQNAIKKQEEHFERLRAEKKDKPKKPTNGFVYFFKCNKTGYTKIGRTKSIESRFSQLKIANPCIEIYGFFEANDMIKAEKELHDGLSPYKVDGEWFDLDNESLDYYIEEYTNSNV